MLELLRMNKVGFKHWIRLKNLLSITETFCSTVSLPLMVILAMFSPLLLTVWFKQDMHRQWNIER